MNAALGSVIVSSVLACSVLSVNHFVETNKAPAILQQQEITNSQGASKSISKVQSYIIQSNSIDLISQHVARIGGEVSDTYPIINAVNALLTKEQYSQLASQTSLSIHEDIEMTTQSANVMDTLVGTLIDADLVNKRYDRTGKGVTIAIVDSGLSYGTEKGEHISRNSNGNPIIVPKYDAINDQDVTSVKNNDYNGHGTHIAAIIGSDLRDGGNDYNGIAPHAKLVSVKAFDNEGKSKYSIVLKGLDWIYNNRSTHDIKIVNLSIGGKATSNYWDDPVNLAVMKLWDAGIVVITSAGNSGKDRDIGVPGNNPYVITVGAIYDNQTRGSSDDRLLSFSSRGPTFEGFVKPDLLAYGGNIKAKMDSTFVQHRNTARIDGTDYYSASGTSQAAAIVTGVAALLLEDDPSLSPDDVKCRLMSSAKLATDGERMTYSPFEQGAGLIDAGDAINSNARGCANVGLDIKLDLANVEHFMGPVREISDGEYVIINEEGSLFTEGNHWGNRHITTRSNQWGSSILGTEANTWGRAVLRLRANQWGGKMMTIRSADHALINNNLDLEVSSLDGAENLNTDDGGFINNDLPGVLSPLSLTDY